MNHQTDNDNSPQTPTSEKSSNLRSRWKRKSNPNQSTKNTANSCGEIDPNAVKETLQKQAKKQPVSPASDAKNTATQPTPATSEWTPVSETPKEKPLREAGHKPHQDVPLLTPHKRQDRKDPTEIKNTEKNLEKPKPKASITPATYQPTDLPNDTLWNRLKDFGGKKPKKHSTKRHSNVTRYDRGNRQGDRRWEKKGGDFHYRKKNHRSHEKGSHDR
jgi:hypothetical protein